MNIEVHKDLLTDHQNAFPVDRTAAVDRLVGDEEIKSRESSHPKAITNNSGDNKNAGNSI